ncbi:hypothetical protein Hypma_013815 [Hypsizygus marmoreus]|uniref:Uncharacterized protein n=1 Tax=Hypsizygus marmoreus TaxID=39966 RepID=A0A369K8E2_HYPMA|nr:hypothetical protein Hypma_013815 [Hypsizygus marmoreus]
MPRFSRNVKALLPLYGDHQLDNLGVAASAISSILTHPSSAHLNLSARVTPATVALGIKSVRWPGGYHSMCSQVDSWKPPLHRWLFSQMGLTIRPHKKKPITITYVLSLSHSPPKTPLQTLSPILPPTLPQSVNQTVKVNVACLRSEQVIVDIYIPYRKSV